jgi:hypothetical protein
LDLTIRGKLDISIGTKNQKDILLDVLSIYLADPNLKTRYTSKIITTYKTTINLYRHVYPPSPEFHNRSELPASNCNIYSYRLTKIS